MPEDQQSQNPSDIANEFEMTHTPPPMADASPTIPSPEPPEEEGAVVLYYIGAIIFGVVAAGVFALFFIPDALSLIFGENEERAREAENQRIQERFVRVSSILDQAKSGDYEEAAEAARGYLEEVDEKTKAHYDALSALETSLFNTGDPEKRVEAVKVVKERYGITGNPASRALILNKIYGFAISRDQGMYDEVFNGEPFEELREETSFASVQNILELSLETFPTSYAYQRLATHRFREATEKRNDPDFDMQALALEILESAERADALHAEEALNYGRHGFAALDQMQFLYSQGILYGFVSTIDPTYLPLAEERFLDIFQVHQSAQLNSGGQQAITAVRLPFTLMRRAYFVHKVTGENRLEDVQSYLKGAVELVEAEPDVHKGSFLSFIRGLKNENTEITGGSLDFRTVVEMAAISPEFKTFAEGLGWDFESIDIEL